MHKALVRPSKKHTNSLNLLRGLNLGELMLNLQKMHPKRSAVSRRLKNCNVPLMPKMVTYRSLQNNAQFTHNVKLLHSLLALKNVIFYINKI